jgi:hypothetical protein
MTNTTQFWKSWQPIYRYAWYITAALFGLSIVFLWISYFRGNDALIDWQKIQEQKVVESTIDTFSVGPFELSVPADNYVILEYFNGSNIYPNVTASYLFMIVLAISVVILLAIITTLDRFWFIVGSILFMLFIASLRLKVLEVFGQLNQIPLIITLMTYTGVSIYFNTINPAIDFRKRLAVFTLLTTGLALIVCFFSTVKYPALHLSVTAYPAALILSILFIVLVCHEIIASFIAILSRAESGSGSVRHFLILCLIYLVNLVVTALHQLGSLDWNFIYVNLYLLLTISGILGVWGFRDRESTYESIMPFYPYGALFFLAVGSTAYATIGGLLGNVNDAALEVIRDTIIYAHLGFSFIFVLYILSNFAGMLGQNLPVYKVLYKPNRMPYFTFQFAGLIVTLAFIFYSGWRFYAYNGVGGFYTALGDLDIKLENRTLAKAHFDQAHSYGFQNHHANYALAKLTTNRFNYEEAQQHYASANNKRPSGYSLINAGNLHLWQNEVFNAIKAFRRGEGMMRESGILANNLGFAYGKIHDLDSATYYLSEAQKHSYSRPSAEANFFALAALEYLTIDSDSVFRTFKSAYTATLANALALANARQQPFSVPVNPFTKHKLDLYSATLLNNYLIRYSKSIDSVSLRKAYALADDSLNSDYSEALKVPIASAYYYQNNVSRALEIMAELVYISNAYKGNYNYTMGLWALEQGNAELAASFFDYAVVQDYKKAKLYKAIALTEAGQLEKARIAWDTVTNGASQGEAQMANAILKILNANPTAAISLADPEKYQFCRYRMNVYDTVFFDRIVKTFQDNNYRANALLDMAQRQFEWNKLNTAIRYFNQLGGLELTDQNLFNKIRHFELLMLAERRELRKLATQINQGIVFTPRQELQKLLFAALISEDNNDTVRAEKNYAILSSYNPYFEEGIIAAARYYKAHSGNRLKAYSVLAEAVQINNNSVKLWSAYIQEATRVGFDEYAQSAWERLEQIKQRLLLVH